MKTLRQIYRKTTHRKRKRLARQLAEEYGMDAVLLRRWFLGFKDCIINVTRVPRKAVKRGRPKLAVNREKIARIKAEGVHVYANRILAKRKHEISR